MRALSVFLAFLFILFLSNYIGSHNMGVLDPKGIIALGERNLMITALCLMLVVIIPIFILLGFILWRYRASNKNAKYTPDWHTNLALETTWWTIPTIVIVLLSILTWKSTHYLDPFKPIDSQVTPITIEVVALDWKWLFIYPDENIATVNFVEFPEGVPINFKITSDAPMNAFWIPQLGGQVYAMSGMTSQLHLLASEVGDYNGVSSNFSGDGFSGMKFIARVVTEDDYYVWLNEVRNSSSSLTLLEYNDLAKQSKNNKVKYYAQVEENLYNKVIMKFMPTMDSMKTH